MGINPHSLANLENVSAEYCGPLSESTTSGMPWRQKSDFIFCGSAFEVSDFKESWIIIHSDNIVLAIMMEKVCGHYLPRFFWECSRYHKQRDFLCVLQQVGHVVTTSSICLLSPGHHTDSRTLSRHLRIPWWPEWIFSKISKRSDDGTINRESFIKTFFWTVMLALSDQ